MTEVSVYLIKAAKHNDGTINEMDFKYINSAKRAKLDFTESKKGRGKYIFTNSWLHIFFPYLFVVRMSYGIYEIHY